MEKEIRTTQVRLWIDPGDATAQDIAELLTALSELNRAYGGVGFQVEDENDINVDG
jgi:hypothetical protein